jgi:hypothetical protein
MAGLTNRRGLHLLALLSLLLVVSYCLFAALLLHCSLLCGGARQCLGLAWAWGERVRM